MMNTNNVDSLSVFADMANEQAGHVASKQRTAQGRHEWESITSLLETAALIAEQIRTGDYPPDRIDSAAWRAADALLLMCRYSETRFPGCPTPGIHEPTGLGAKLDTSRETQS